MKIGVLGAGWLGKTLVELLREIEKNEVRFTNRVETVGDSGSFAFEFGNSIPQGFIDELDVLFISSTLPRNEADAIADFVHSLQIALPKTCKIVLTSTIGVYQDVDVVVDENTSFINEESVYYNMEQLLFNNFPGRTIILRLGGLIGEDRHPITTLAGREGVADGQKGVNLVHRGDILRFCQLIVDAKVPHGIYNLVYAQHPKKGDYYTKQAIERQLVPPSFLSGNANGKIVDSAKSLAIEGFSYTYSI